MTKDRSEGESTSSPEFTTATVLSVSSPVLPFNTSQRVKVQLQETVKQRTREIEIQKDKIEQDKNIIEQQAEKLKELNAVQSRWFTNIAHELRTPLTLILGPIRQFLKTHTGKTTKTEIANIQLAEKNSTSLLKLVNEILDVSKLESNRLKIHKTPTDLTSLIKESAAHFDSFAVEKGVMLEMQTPVDIEVNIDKDQVQKILINLVSNALKFTHAGGKVTVSAEHISDEGIIISVADTGDGIAEEDLPHIFERYFQTSDTKRINQGGAGIGLALSQELARLHGGTISAESQVGKGSTFSLFLPEELIITSKNQVSVQSIDTTISPLITSVKSPHHIIPGDGDRPLILLVEDNPDMRKYIRGFMAVNYEIVEAADGVEALEHVKEINPELIISDIMMPRMDGITLAKTIKSDENFSHLPFITLTAKADEPDKIAALRTGIDDYLTKPFNAEELEARATNLIQNYRARKAVFQKDADEIAEPAYQDKQIAAMKALVMEHIQDSAFTVSMLAESQHTTERSLNRFLQKATGLSPGKFIREIKLQHARRLLEARQYPTVQEVAYAIGFEKVSHFITLFSERFGKKPSEYL